VHHLISHADKAGCAARPGTRSRSARAAVHHLSIHSANRPWGADPRCGPAVPEAAGGDPATAMNKEF